MKVGGAQITIGQGCHAGDACFPEAYAWVRAQACLFAPGEVTLEAERLVEDDPLLVIPLEARPTGDPACPYRAAGLAEFWMALVDTPVDCVRASLVSASGVVATRAACFSDL